MTKQDFESIQHFAKLARQTLTDRRPFSGDGNCDHVIDSLERTMTLIERVDLLDLVHHVLDPKRLEAALKALSKIHRAVENLPMHQKAEKLGQSLVEIQSILGPAAGMAVGLEFVNDVKRRQELLETRTEELLTLATRLCEEIKANAEAAKRALEEIQYFHERSETVLAASLVESHKNHFAEQADAYVEAGRIWWKAAAGFAASTLIAASVMIWLAATGALGQDFSVQVTIGKVFILSLLSSGVAFSAKNYFAASHNAAVNRHRSSALRAFPSLYMSTENQTAKDQVLLEMTRAVLAAQPTGYSKGSEGGGTSIIEVLGNLRSKE